MTINPETRIDLALYDLERLGLWLQAEEAEWQWRNHRMWLPTYEDKQIIPSSLWADLEQVNRMLAH